MRGEVVAIGPANRDFCNISIGLPVDDVLWVASFWGDRVGYTSLNRVD